jgi:hypothetical protein
MSKSNSDKAYDEGYDAGKNADAMDNISRNLADFKFAWEDDDSSEERAYKAGFEDGATDKYDSDDSHYQGGEDDDD